MYMSFNRILIERFLYRVVICNNLLKYKFSGDIATSLIE